MKKLTLILLTLVMIVTLAACGNKCEQHVYDDCADTECNVCGDKRDSMHTWTEADCTTAKTCSVCGATEGSALGHEWTTPDVDLCEVQSTCSRCGATDGENKEHTPAEDDGDCTTEVKCTVCGDVTTPAGQHTPNTDDGNCLTAITCQNCSEELTAARSEHEANEDDGDCTTAITCKHCTTVLTEAKSAHEAGEDDGNCTTDIICKFCEQVAVAGNASHTPNDDDGDCTTAITCSICGTVTTEAKESHTPNADDGDCTTAITCSVCGTVTTEAKEAHTPNDDDGDCTTAITCSVCGTVTTEANEAHTLTVYITNADGTHTPACQYCHHLEPVKEPHTPEADDGDCTTLIVCYKCGLITTPARDSHTGGTATCIEKAECEVCGSEYGDLNPDNHASEEFTYTANAQISTHTKAHECCEAIVSSEEEHTFDSITGECVCGVKRIEISAFSVTGAFPGGWENADNYGGDWNLDEGGGIKDLGKTAWVDGDKILVHLYSDEYGHQTVEMTFENGDWKSDGGTLRYLDNESPTITAVYAPDYEIKSDGSIGLKEGKLLGMAEYISAKTTISENTLDVCFESGRSYSRLRIATMPGAEITVKTTGFTLAGATEAGEHNYTLTADANGNAYLYGTFAKNGTVTATAKHEIYPTDGITKTSRTNFFDDGPSKNGASYVLAVKLGDYADPKRALSGDIALSDGSFVSNYMIDSMTEEQKAAAVGIVFWTVVETDPTGRTYPATLTDDKVMNADFPQCTHGLIVSFKQLEMAWQSTTESVADFQSQSGDFNDYVSIAQSTDAATFNQVFGYQNTKVLQAYNAYCEVNGKTANVVNPVAALDEFSADTPAPFGSTGWYLPSAKELHMLCHEDVDDINNVNGTNNKIRLNYILSHTNIGGDTLGDGYYWSSTESSQYVSAFAVRFSDGDVYAPNKRIENYYVRFICAF